MAAWRAGSVITASNGLNRANSTTAGRRQRPRLPKTSRGIQEAWERLRETAVSLGDQRIYASHKSIMFARASCYFFVRPKKQFLEVVMFLGRALKAPQVKRTEEASKSKVANFLHIRHRDEVEPPITDWLQEAYDYSAAKKTIEDNENRPPRRSKRR